MKLSPLTSFRPDTEGAFEGMPFEFYCKAPGLNHSALSKLDPPSTPAHFRCYLDEPHPEATDEQVLGSLLHQAVLEPELPPPFLAIKPDGMKFSTTEGKAWRSEMKAAGRVIVTEERWTTLEAFRRRCTEHPTIRMIFDSGGQSEVSLFGNRIHNNASLWTKARVDWVPAGGNALVDIKTTIDASPEKFSKSLWEWAYYSQAAWYLDLWNHLFPDDWRDTFVFIALEKQAPYLPAIYELGPKSIEMGRRANARRLDLYAACRESNRWPGYPVGVVGIEVPEWALRREIA